MAKPLIVDEAWLERIAVSLNGLEYGTVQIVVHDGNIMQIDRTERRRFDAETSRAAISAVPESRRKSKSHS
ncbi:YezD family protein [Paenibacillus chartarius]|uniref:YezD family protein n=1 Tax=Paenibacillus chartarius TaxID=747481 RepID=A0ABV6DPT9_9BACL